jgi:hypothetical protein
MVAEPTQLNMQLEKTKITLDISCFAAVLSDPFNSLGFSDFVLRPFCRRKFDKPIFVNSSRKMKQFLRSSQADRIEEKAQILGTLVSPLHQRCNNVFSETKQVIKRMGTDKSNEGS